MRIHKANTTTSNSVDLSFLLVLCLLGGGGGGHRSIAHDIGPGEVFVVHHRLDEFAIDEPGGQQRQLPLSLLLRLGHAEQIELERAHPWWVDGEGDSVAHLILRHDALRVHLHRVCIEQRVRQQHCVHRLEHQATLPTPGDHDRTLLAHHLQLEVVEFLCRPPGQIVEWEGFDVFACLGALQREGDHRRQHHIQVLLTAVHLALGLGKHLFCVRISMEGTLIVCELGLTLRKNRPSSGGVTMNEPTSLSSFSWQNT